VRGPAGLLGTTAAPFAGVMAGNISGPAPHLCGGRAIFCWGCALSNGRGAVVKKRRTRVMKKREPAYDLVKAAGPRSFGTLVMDSAKCRSEVLAAFRGRRRRCFARGLRTQRCRAIGGALGSPFEGSQGATTRHARNRAAELKVVRGHRSAYRLGQRSIAYCPKTSAENRTSATVRRTPGPVGRIRDVAAFTAGRATWWRVSCQNHV